MDRNDAAKLRYASKATPASQPGPFAGALNACKYEIGIDASQIDPLQFVILKAEVTICGN